jgi:hypothetical protein
MEGVSAGVTSEAVIDLLRRVHGERGRLLSVEGAQPGKRAPGFLEADVLLDETHDVGAFPDGFDVVLVNARHVSHSTGKLVPQEPCG